MSVNLGRSVSVNEGVSRELGAGGETLTPKDFSPLDLPGLVLWLDAQDDNSITLVSDRVSVWADKSGNGHNATQVSATRRPALSVINTRQAIDFEGDIDIDQGLDMVNTAELTGIFAGGGFWAVVMNRDTGINNHLIQVGTTAGATALRVRQTTAEYELFFDKGFSTTAGSWETTATLRLDNGVPVFVSVEYDQDSVNNNPLFTHDGAAFEEPDEITTPVGTASPENSDWVIGNRNISGGRFDDAWDGQVGEIIFCRTVPTTAQQSRLWLYFEDRWGIQRL